VTSRLICAMLAARLTHEPNDERDRTLLVTIITPRRIARGWFN
jgi:hypothetical protein